MPFDLVRLPSSRIMCSSWTSSGSNEISIASGTSLLSYFSENFYSKSKTGIEFQTCEMTQNDPSKYFIRSTNKKLSMSACILSIIICSVRALSVRNNSTKTNKCLHIVYRFEFFSPNKMLCHLMHFCPKYLSVMKCVRMRH